MVKFKDFTRPLRVFSVLFKTDLIFKDFSRKPSNFKYFSSPCEPCKKVNIYLLYPSFLPFVLGAQMEMVLLSINNISFCHAQIQEYCQGGPGPTTRIQP